MCHGKAFRLLMDVVGTESMTDTHGKVKFDYFQKCVYPYESTQGLSMSPCAITIHILQFSYNTQQQLLTF